MKTTNLFARASLALALIAPLLAGAPARAAEDVGLSSLLVDPPAGFTLAEGAGAFNGPVTGDDIARVAPQFAPTFDSLSHSHDIEAYARTWVDGRGGSAVVLLYRLRNSALGYQFMRGVRRSYSALPESNRFDTSSIPDSIGIVQSVGKYRAHEVMVRRARYVADVTLGSAGDHYTNAEAVAFAQRQRDALPQDEGQPSTGATIIGLVILLGLLATIVMLIVYVVRRRRRRRMTPAEPAGLRCVNGHPMLEGDHFCAVCGAGVSATPSEPAPSADG